MAKAEMDRWKRRVIPIGYLPVRTVALASVLLMAGSLTACSSSGGGDDDSSGDGAVTFGGTFNASDAFPNARVVPGVNVCALGSCDLTDELGQWAFAVPESSYGGGSIQFSFSGSGVDTSTTVGNLNPNSRSIAIDFTVISDGSVVADQVSQDGTPAPDPTPEPSDDGDDDSGPLPADPQARACAILDRSNISIPNFVPVVNVAVGATCPVDIDDIVVIGNSKPIPYEYEITVDTVDALTVDPNAGSVTGTQLNKHDGHYLCSRIEDFTATITATVTRYMPSDGSEPISAADAIQLCGRNASVGNTAESVQVTFDLP